MFSRVLKSNTQQQPAPASQPPTSPTKNSRAKGHAKSESNSFQPSPSKLPLPTTPVSRSSFNNPAAKENNPAPPAQADRTNYLSFLFAQSQTGAPTTPVKVNKVLQSSVPVVHHNDKRAQQQSSRIEENEDVHMQTMKNTINPAMLKSLATLPPPSKVQQAVANPYAVQRNGQGLGSEDVHMKTTRPEPRIEKERSLELWEREMLEKAEVRRKATVAQICGCLNPCGMECLLSIIRFPGLLLYALEDRCVNTADNRNFLSRPSRLHLQPQKASRSFQGRRYGT